MSCLEDEISRLMGKCIGCSICTDHCPSHRHGGLDPHKMMTQRRGISWIVSCVVHVPGYVTVRIR
ncbi:MAG: hypothetical protein E7Z67_01740 [Thermoplasmata archaeon]|nr:hypothetical protein [Thermoplasmata archaeon]